MTRFKADRLVFGPDEVDLSRSPLAGHLDAETYVLGAFNPGMTRLPNGNLAIFVRVAEALRHPVRDGKVHAIRWEAGRYQLDGWPLDQCDTSDPRKFLVRGGKWRVMALTYEQTFFEKLGFAVVAKETLPLKVWGECIQCPKRDGCDEIAMVRELPDVPLSARPEATPTPRGVSIPVLPHGED